MRRGLGCTRLDVRRRLTVVQVLRRMALAGPGTPGMKKVEDYRQHANECRLMANRSHSPEEQDMLINMANTWDSLANDREAHISRQKRMAEIR
jgi:hypothetical protein